MTIARMMYIREDGKIIETVPFETEKSLSEQVRIETESKTPVQIMFTVDNEGKTYARKPFVDSIISSVENVVIETK